MESLLEKVIDAHGGMKRWQELQKVKVIIRAGGKLMDLVQVTQKTDPREMTVFLHEQHSQVKPYGAPDRFTDFTPTRIAIKTDGGEVIEERTGTPEEIHLHETRGTWDPLDAANFNGYAMWNYMTVPFCLTMPGITLTEIAPWQETEHESWQGLRVTFPPEMAVHSAVQDYYFGDDFLLRRLDYHTDYAGDQFYAHYVYDMTEVSGIIMPTKRRAYIRGEDGRPVIEDLMIWIDMNDIRYS